MSSDLMCLLKDLLRRHVALPLSTHHQSSLQMSSLKTLSVQIPRGARGASRNKYFVLRLVTRMMILSSVASMTTLFRVKVWSVFLQRRQMHFVRKEPEAPWEEEAVGLSSMITKLMMTSLQESLWVVSRSINEWWSLLSTGHRQRGGCPCFRVPRIVPKNQICGLSKTSKRTNHLDSSCLTEDMVSLTCMIWTGILQQVHQLHLISRRPSSSVVTLPRKLCSESLLWRDEILIESRNHPMKPVESQVWWIPRHCSVKEMS